jgi:thiamine-phosphate diphosphorylase
LVLVGPPVVAPSMVLEASLAAEAGGATAVQIRWKNAPTGDLLQVTTDVVRALSIPTFVNDRADVAWAANAYGIHLGPEDLPVDRVRQSSSSPLCIGTSVGDDLEVESALRTGADYWGIGSVFSTETKSDAGPAIGIEGFKRLAARAPRATVTLAIGGITVETVGAVMEAGADGVAVSAGIVGRRDVVQAARQFREILDQYP